MRQATTRQDSLRRRHANTFLFATRFLAPAILAITPAATPFAAAEQFPPLRHGVKAVFGPNGNDHNGDLAGAGAIMAKAFHDLDVDLTRIEFKWAVIEAQRGVYDWSELDRLINFLHANNVEPMLMLYCAPTWAMRGTPADEQLFIDRRQQNLHTVVWPRRDCMRDFERFCETAARRYRDKARLWEFWNEPDGMAGPQVYHDKNGKAVDVRYGGDAAEYTFWLKRMYAAVKRGNPDAVIAAGSLCVHEMNFIEAMYAAGCREYCDAISLHPYAGDGINVDWVNQVRGVMEQYGDQAKGVWLSEFGWHLDNRYDEKTDKWNDGAYRQAEIIRRTAPVIESLPYITQAYWFTLNDWNTSQTGIDPTGTHHYGLMTLDLQRRPAFDAMKEVVAGTPDSPRPIPEPVIRCQPPSTPVDGMAELKLPVTVLHPDQRLLANARLSVTCNPTTSETALPVQAKVSPSLLRNSQAISLTWENQPMPGSFHGLIDVSVRIANAPVTEFPVAFPAKAAYVDAAPEIDGDLGDWAYATALIRDGSMTAAFVWSDTHLFLACAIDDDIHEQPHNRADIWKGDCIQLAVDPHRDAIRGSQYDMNDSEFAIALTGDGPLIWRYIHPIGSYAGEVEPARLAIRRVDNRTQYELAIPWIELQVDNTAVGRHLGLSIAGCDWDGGERTVYHFGDGIIGRKQPYRFASIELADRPLVPDPAPLFSNEAGR